LLQSALVAASIALNRAAPLRFHLNLALENGPTPVKITEEITNLAFYTGWPNAMAAIGVAKE
jgi:4-carboxymuconolactone decarboxylase